MTLPKTLQPDTEYADDIRDENGDLVISVAGGYNSPNARELRDEIIRRWNSYETLQDTLATVTKLLDEVFQN